MKKTFKLAFVGLFSTLLIAASYNACYWIAETYFFDKFFYQKSTTFGYWVDQNKTLKQFGERTKDLVEVIGFSNGQKTKQADVLGITTKGNKQYVVYIIGDSYVFGVGVRQEERFAGLLNKKLNTLKPSRVHVFGNSGNGFIENYLVYKEALISIGPPDLLIVGLHSNDFLLNNWCLLRCKETEIIKSDCDGKSVYDIFANTLNSEDIQKLSYEALMERSMQTDTRNYCIAQKTLSLMPRTATIYIIFDEMRFPYARHDKILRNFLNAQGINAYSPMPHLRMHYPDLYLKAMNQGKADDLSVSLLEKHPSRLAHKIYAEALFEEIITRPEFDF